MADLRKKVQTKELQGRVLSPSSVSECEALGWENFYDRKEMLPNGICVYKGGEEESTGGSLVLLLHGAGLGAMSWAVVARQLKKHCTVVSYDCRGHGETTLTEDDMSYATLVENAKEVLTAVNPQGKPVVLIGHSMGGAIAIRTALELPRGVLSALVVLDVVEGTAMAALPKMMSILQSRPQKFDSVKTAIAWGLSSGTVRNKEAACVSIPQQVVQNEAGEYVWRTDLRKTQVFWKGWFENMSNLFLSVAVPKLLILADTDRLDTPLTTGQMMGKFQMSIVPNVGHLIQEDAPDKTYAFILNFLQRFKLV